MRKILTSLFLLASLCVAQAQIVNTLPFQLQNGTTADATQVMADFNQIVNNVNSNAAKNGANSDITSLTGLTTPLAPTYGGSSVYTGTTSGGSVNAQTTTASPSGFTLALGKRIVFVAGSTNTGPLQLNVSSTGLVNVFYPTPSGPLALVGGEVKSGNIVEAWYDGTQYQLITNNLALLGPLTGIAAAATTDLGTVATHNVNVTSAATISSFGSSASAAYPIYYLTFFGVNTLTYNASSMILPGAADITTAAGDTAIAQYLGSGNWKVWSYQRASGSSVIANTPLCGATTLQITNNAGTPNTNIDYSAGTAVLVNSGGVTKTVTSLSGTINTTNVGVVDGIQGARTNSIWYDIYFISNGTTNGGFAVAHGTSLSAPSGYTFSCYMGGMQTDASGNYYRLLLKGNIGHWVGGKSANQAPCLVSNGVVGTYSATNPTLTATSVAANGACAPPTATMVNISASANWKGTAADVLVAPSASYSGANNGPVGTNGNVFPIWLLTTSTGASAWLTLESTNIYIASDTIGGAVFLSDWKDAVNAN